MTRDTSVKSHSFVKSARKRSWRVPKIVRLLGIKNFVWVVGLAGLIGLVAVKGTPHVLYTYTYTHSKTHKSECSYLGLHSQTIHARAGRCPALLLLKPID